MTNAVLTIELLAEIQRGYLTNLPVQFDECEHLVLLFEKDPTDRDTYANLFRKIHSLKGAAGTYGFNIVSWICHQFEDQLTLMDPANTNAVAGQTNVLLEHVDLLRRTLPALHRADTDFHEIESELGKLKIRAAHHDFQCLIVESSSLGRQMVVNALAGINVETITESDGMAALERLLREKFDLIITTYEVGKLNGLALIGATKLARGINRDIKSILLTSRKEIDTTSSLKPDSVIIKDVNWPMAVAETVEKALKSKTQ